MDRALLGAILERSAVEPERVRIPEASPDHPDSGRSRPGGDHVLYWMQKAQRAEDNPALDLAVAASEALGLPLLVLFVLTDYPGANPHHYRFMLAGLRGCAKELRDRGMGFSLRRGADMAETVLSAARSAALIVCDEGRLRFEREWRERVATGHPRVVIVETEAVVPPDTASPREEYGAATLRPRISANLPRFLSGIEARLERGSLSPSRLYPARIQESDDSLFEAWDGPITPSYPGDRVPEQNITADPGHDAGMERFRIFVENGGLERYESERNDPSLDGRSGMSPYLHFGQVAAGRLALAALERPGPSSQAYVEQLVVRRELAVNFTLRNPGYDRFGSAVPGWAREALAAVRSRPDAQGETVLEAGATDDRYWNAAQNEMVLTGSMHNYMRMYWGKRILAWRRDPAEAFGMALRLNDRYSLDGRDPNGYAGIAWCFGRHDRPWPLQPLFGSVRAMVPAGLKRKFDISAYAARIESMYIRKEREE